MNNPSSPLDTLRQLKEMLDAGALTPTEFEALKQRLVFSEPRPPAAPTEPVAEPIAPAAPVAEPPAPAPPVSGPPVVPASPTFTELRSPVLGPQPVRPSVPPVGSASPAPPAGPLFPESQPEAAVPPAPFAAPPAPEPDANASWATDEFPESERAAPRSPLALVLSIGGLLALLSLVVYLSLNRPPSERISSTSLTAADSVAAPIETGPQAEQLPPPPEAVPETVRVAPSNPAPPFPARRAPAVRDSVAPTPDAFGDSVAP